MGLNFSPSRHRWSLTCPAALSQWRGGWRKWPGPPLSVSDSRERDGVVKQNIASIDLGRNFLPSGETVCAVMCDFRIWNCSVLWKLCCEEKNLIDTKYIQLEGMGAYTPPPITSSSCLGGPLGPLKNGGNLFEQLIKNIWGKSIDIWLIYGFVKIWP